MMNAGVRTLLGAWLNGSEAGRGCSIADVCCRSRKREVSNQQEKGGKDECFWEIAHHFYGRGSGRLRAK
jgi:hypothetical protein